MLPQLVVIWKHPEVGYLRYDNDEAAEGGHMGVPFCVEQEDLEERVFDYDKGFKFLNKYLERAEAKVKDDREVGVIFGKPIMTTRDGKFHYPAHFFEFDLKG